MVSEYGGAQMVRLDFQKLLRNLRLISACFTTILVVASLAFVSRPAASQTVQICGSVWNDQNCDGIPADADDVRMAGVVVTLYDSAHNFVASTVSVTTFPGFDFMGPALVPGTYYLVVTVPAGFQATGVWSEIPAGAGTKISNTEIRVDAFPNNFSPPRYIFSTQNFLICQGGGGPGGGGGNGATRTQGYWATHLSAMQLLINSGCLNLGACGPPTLGRAEAIMWGKIPKQGSVDRSDLGQARMKLGQQLVAAYANACLLGTSPTGWTLIDATNALNGTDVQLINSFQGLADQFNNSGDGIALDPSQAGIAGSATPTAAKAAADKTNGVIDPGPCFL